MKKILSLSLTLLIFLLLGIGAFLFVTSPQPHPEKGPRAHYRVVEGAVEVFSLKNGEIQSLLGLVMPGETLTAPMVSNKSSFWLSWIEPALVDAVRNARHFMYKEGKKTKRREFTVGYTDQTIYNGFTRELEKSRVLSDVRMEFYPDGFFFYAKALGLSISARGSVSVIDGLDDKLFLHLRWLKIGSVTLPEGVLRSIENIFANAYAQSGQFPIRLQRVTFKNQAVVMSFRKTLADDPETSV